MLKTDTMESAITHRQSTTGKWEKMASIVRQLCMVVVKGGAQDASYRIADVKIN